MISAPIFRQAQFARASCACLSLSRRPIPLRLFCSTRPDRLSHTFWCLHGLTTRTHGPVLCYTTSAVCVTRSSSSVPGSPFHAKSTIPWLEPGFAGRFRSFVDPSERSSPPALVHREAINSTTWLAVASYYFIHVQLRAAPTPRRLLQVFSCNCNRKSAPG